MSKFFDIIHVLLANFGWFVSCLTSWMAFHLSTRNVKRAQTSILRRILKENASTVYGRTKRFNSISTPQEYESVPLCDYEDLAEPIALIRQGKRGILTREPISLFQPTSGSTDATKLIPYTKSLGQEFQAGINPWIASLFLTHPSILFGRHYWAISPNTPYPLDSPTEIPIGFDNDSEYLGVTQRLLSRALFAVPDEIARVQDQDAFEYLTLLFLCREKNLRVISVWHPSFLTTLARKLPQHFPAILCDIESGGTASELPISKELREDFEPRLTTDARRANELRRIGPLTLASLPAIWPKLRIISCWTEGNSAPWISELHRLFPRALIQGKGLIATEGIVSFPMGPSGRRICAIRSHFLEFIDCDTRKCLGAWEVMEGKEYSVVLSTGGGLYRYRLHDIVRVTGFYNEAPVLEFIARDNYVSDLVGEKLNGRHVEESIGCIEEELGQHFQFAMMAPVETDDGPAYVLYIQPADSTAPDYHLAASLMEGHLNRNFHYRHARRLGQLHHLRVFRVDGEAGEMYRQHFIKKGMKPGDIKFQGLSRDRSWSAEFRGQYVA